MRQGSFDGLVGRFADKQAMKDEPRPPTDDYDDGVSLQIAKSLTLAIVKKTFPLALKINSRKWIFWCVLRGGARESMEDVVTFFRRFLVIWENALRLMV